MKYKILIFDLDDTLIDNIENVKAAFSTMLNEKGLSASNRNFNRGYELDKKFWIDWQEGKKETLTT